MNQYTRSSAFSVTLLSSTWRFAYDVVPIAINTSQTRELVSGRLLEHGRCCANVDGVVRACSTIPTSNTSDISSHILFQENIIVISPPHPSHSRPANQPSIQSPYPPPRPCSSYKSRRRQPLEHL